MQVDQILSDFVNHVGEEPRRRQIGRYWASDAGSLRKGYLTPESFFSTNPIEMSGVRMILTGVAFEDCLTKIFKKQGVDVEPQAKNIIELNDNPDDPVKLVVKPDYVFPDFLIETKFPFSPIVNSKIPTRYEYQLECEARAFPDKRVFLGVFSVPFQLYLIEYIPSKRRWNNIKKSLLQFHEDVKKYAAEHNIE